MGKHGKLYRQAAGLLETGKKYEPREAVSLVRQTSKVKFDPTVEAHLRLGVDPKHADQVVRGSVVLPHGTGKKVRIAVFAQGEKAREAMEAGADAVGADDLVKKVSDGWLDFDVARAVRDVRAGRIEFRVDKAGIVHAPIGKASFDEDKLYENFVALVDAIMRAKPSGAKGTYLRTVTLASAMGPPVKVDPAEAASLTVS
jgi:large subunit ribosomal protein L1